MVEISSALYAVDHTTTMAFPTASAIQTSIPLWYRCFFLYIEPASTFVGAYYAGLQQQMYLDLTHIGSAPLTGIPTGTSIVLWQLANLYLLFALNEALVLRSTADLKVWKTLLFCLLIADFGHLYSVRMVGIQIYWNVSSWNAIDWGNIGFVYAGAATRICFLLGLGLGPSPRTSVRRRKANA